jgi:glycosyltransferase involved in cell wall biosynthesis
VNARVSVVMAVFNGRKFLRQQVDSVVAQLEPDDELLIIDDASTDDGLASIQPLAFRRVRIVRNVRNLGVIRSFGRGLALASHDVVFLCDQDDIWLPGKRAAYAAEFERDAAICVVISDCEIIDATDRVIAASFMATRGGFNGSVSGTLWRNCYIGCAMAVRRSLLQIALPFPAHVPMHDMWLGALGSIFGRVVYLQRPYLRYRRHMNNMTPSRSPRSWHQLLGSRVALAWLLALRVLSVRLGLHRVVNESEAARSP